MIDSVDLTLPTLAPTLILLHIFIDQKKHKQCSSKITGAFLQKHKFNLNINNKN